MPGDGLDGLAECVRGECSVERAAVVAPLTALVVAVIVRGFAVAVWGDVWCAGCAEVVLDWIAWWALKAARKCGSESAGRILGAMPPPM